MSDDLFDAELKLMYKVKNEYNNYQNFKIRKVKEVKLKNIFYILFLFMLLIISVYIFIKRYPYIKTTSTNPRVIRNGTYETDIKTDECISNIWKLRVNKNLKLLCPISKKEYIVNESGIYCPTPHLHGFSYIGTKNNGIPEVR